MCIITEKYVKINKYMQLHRDIENQNITFLFQPIQRATEELASTPSSATLTFSFSKDEKEYGKLKLNLNM